MNTQVGRSAGIALLLAMGLLALLFAFGVFSPQATPGVSAHECQNPDDDHADNPASDETDGTDCNQPGQAAGDHDTTRNHEITGLDEEYTFTIAENVKGNNQLVAHVQASFRSGDNVTYSITGVEAGTGSEQYATIAVDGTVAATGTLPTADGQDFLNVYPDGRIYYQETAVDATAGTDSRNGFDWELITAGTPAQVNTDRTKAKVITAYIVASPPDGPDGDTDPDGAPFVATLTIMVTDTEAGPPTGLMAEPDKGDASADPAVPASPRLSMSNGTNTTPLTSPLTKAMQQPPPGTPSDTAK